MEKEYNIEVREILSRNVSVRAHSYEEAQKMVEDKYYNEEIVLDYSDHQSTYFFSVPNSTAKEVAAYEDEDIN